MGIHVIQSQRLDVLLQGVMASMNQPSSSPFQVFQTQHFIVPSPAQEQWLTQKLLSSKACQRITNFTSVFVVSMVCLSTGARK